MCGIAGFIDRRRVTPPAELTATVEAMAERLRHRGPDDKGAWIDVDAGVALAIMGAVLAGLSILSDVPAGQFLAAGLVTVTMIAAVAGLYLLRWRRGKK